MASVARTSPVHIVQVGNPPDNGWLFPYLLGLVQGFVPAFVGVQVATLCLGAGMFALFPFLSIYLQDIDGYSALGAGLRFLPITAFVFLVPLVTRKRAATVPMWLLLGGSLTIIAVGLGLVETVSSGSSWTVLLPGFIVCGIAAYLSIRFLVRWFQTRTLTPFAIYCLVFGLLSVFRFI